MFKKIAPSPLDSFETQLEMEKTVYISVHLDQYPFWKRLWRGLGYIVGKRSKYGDFAETLTSKEKLQKIIDQL